MSDSRQNLIQRALAPTTRPTPQPPAANSTIPPPSGTPLPTIQQAFARNRR
ncbi:hypothetical protein Lalb_Chr10g0091101 [Lupinus albus]|uniref:Uncharacterized protein n=1 Tax=Lupinus albus TaxID=3870 RepID=A0A6A4PT83_LUPAL|nr:hypothetical protein Lalb_Chr10g0091101 [Lupinus albus]